VTGKKRGAPGAPLFFVPYLGLGAPLFAKLILAAISVPKFILGTVAIGKPRTFAFEVKNRLQGDVKRSSHHCLTAL
jgi:hypothetical protein